MIRLYSGIKWLNINFNALVNKREFTSSTTNVKKDEDDELKRIDNLKKLFEPYHKPLFYDEYALENSQVKALKRASVLVPISYDQTINEYEFTLTKRTDVMRTHKGQICFVGGMKDENDHNDEITAYREAKEEVGLDKEKNLIFLAQLIPTCTTAGVLITPIITYFKNKSSFMPKINKDEVDYMFNLPTKSFLDKNGHRAKIVGIDHKFYLHYFDRNIIDYVSGQTKSVSIWGVTAFMSICISALINSKLPNFDVDPVEKFTFTNLNQFLEHYLKVKSKSLIHAYATKPKTTSKIMDKTIY